LIISQESSLSLGILLQGGGDQSSDFVDDITRFPFLERLLELLYGDGWMGLNRRRIEQISIHHLRFFELLLQRVSLSPEGVAFGLNVLKRCSKGIQRHPLQAAIARSLECCISFLFRLGELRFEGGYSLVEGD
jgi:hypothetical protein